MKNLLVATLLIFSAFTFAQEKMENESNSAIKRHLQHEEREAIRLKKLTSELNLNMKQQEQIKVFLAEQKAKRESFMKERMENKKTGKEISKEEMKAKKEEMKEVKAQMDEKLKTILTSEQFEKWSTLKKEAKARMKEHKTQR